MKIALHILLILLLSQKTTTSPRLKVSDADPAADVQDGAAAGGLDTQHETGNLPSHGKVRRQRSGQTGEAVLPQPPQVRFCVNCGIDLKNIHYTRKRHLTKNNAIWFQFCQKAILTSYFLPSCKQKHKNKQ